MNAYNINDLLTLGHVPAISVQSVAAFGAQKMLDKRGVISRISTLAVLWVQLR